MRKKKLVLGDIYEIPLPNGLNAYGRLYREYTLAIYKKRCKSVLQLPPENEYEFFVGVYEDLLHDGEWKLVESRPFATEEETWAPPLYVRDMLNGKISLYIKGKMIPSTEEECKGLEAAAAWDRHHVVDRLMGETKWNDIL